MSVWSWIHDWVDEAAAKGDMERLQLRELQQEASALLRQDPGAALSVLEEARALAQRLGEPWWVLLLDHWKLQGLLNYQRDYRHVLDIAVRATLEARKPQYARLPQRICLHEDLISACLGIDPLGQADAIRKALDYMRSEVGDDVECRYCLQNCRAEFAQLRGDVDETEAAARVTLEMAEGDPEWHTAEHHAAYAHCLLCEVCHHRGDWEAVREAAEEGERLARRTERDMLLGELLLWRAVVARHDAEEEWAKKLYRQALRRAQSEGSEPGKGFYDVRCLFLETGGDLEKALTARDEELKGLVGRGRLFDECRCRIQRCRLLVKMGEPMEGELEKAWEAARKLRDPSPHTAELQRIERGEF